MAALLNTLLETTVYSGILFLVIFIFKKVFRKHISASLNYAVWMLLVVRLLIPITIDSNIRLIVIPEGTVAVAQTEAGDVSEFSFRTGDESAEDATSSQLLQSTPTDVNLQSTVANSSAQAARVIRIDWETIVVGVWALGIVIYVAYVTFLHGRFRGMLKRSRANVPADVLAMVDVCKKELGIRAHIRVLRLSSITTPAMTLSLRPTLLLPESMLGTMSREQVALGIRHELVHYKRRDHLTRLLLMLLRGIYWFNPVVWVADRMILADMETACDASVTACLEKEKKDLYIHTIIDLGSDRFARCTMGMGVNGKKNIERRIRGMFMKKKSRRCARATVLLLVPMLLVMCFTTACQPTPEEPIVVNKAEGLSGLIQSTPDTPSSVSPSVTEMQTNDALYTKLEAPKHWTFETTALGGKINVSADVDIELPNVAKLPAATASLSEFTQEDLETIAEVLGIKGSEWTEVVNVPSKERIKQWIIEDKEEIAYSDDSFRVEKAKDNLKAHEQMYIDAPYESELIKILTEFEMSEVEYMEDTTGVRFEGTTMINEQPFYFYAGNVYGKSVRTVRAGFGSGSSFFGTYIDKPYGVSLTKEQAAEQASEIAEQLTDELRLCYVVPTGGQKQEDMSRNWGWACVFMREINGCPTAYESTDVGSDMETTVSEPVPYEKMVIVMDDMGMVSFTWETPMTVESIDNPDVALMPFDKIAQRAAAQIGQHWVYSAVEAKSNEGKDMSDPGCTAKITKVELGLMRVAKADSDDYYYIPVWNFFTDLEHTDDYWERIGEEPYSWEDHDYVDEDGNSTVMSCSYPQAWGAVTINALDGSVIDRDLGY